MFKQQRDLLACCFGWFLLCWEIPSLSENTKWWGSICWCIGAVESSQWLMFPVCPTAPWCLVCLCCWLLPAGQAGIDLPGERERISKSEILYPWHCYSWCGAHMPQIPHKYGEWGSFQENRGLFSISSQQRRITVTWTLPSDSIALLCAHGLGTKFLLWSCVGSGNSGWRHELFPPFFASQSLRGQHCGTNPIPLLPAAIITDGLGGEAALGLPRATISHPSRIDSAVLLEAGSCCFPLSCASDENLVMFLSPHLLTASPNEWSLCTLEVMLAHMATRVHLLCTMCRVTCKCWLSWSVPHWACCSLSLTRVKDLLWCKGCLENQEGYHTVMFNPCCEEVSTVLLSAVSAWILMPPPPPHFSAFLALGAGCQLTDAEFLIPAWFFSPFFIFLSLFFSLFPPRVPCPHKERAEPAAA